MDARYPFEQASVHEGNEEEYPSYGSYGNEPARPVGVLDKRSYGGRKVDNDEKIGFADGGFGTSFFHSRCFEGRSNLPVFPRGTALNSSVSPILRAANVGRESLGPQLEKVDGGSFSVTRIWALIVTDAFIPSVLSRYAIPRIEVFMAGHSQPVEATRRVATLETERTTFWDFEKREKMI